MRATGTAACRTTRRPSSSSPSAGPSWPGRKGWEAPDRIASLTEVETAGWREACAGLPLSHMGRGPDEDPRFFEAAYAAGVLARTLWPS